MLVKLSFHPIKINIKWSSNRIQHFTSLYFVKRVRLFPLNVFFSNTLNTKNRNSEKIRSYPKYGNFIFYVPVFAPPFKTFATYDLENCSVKLKKKKMELKRTLK